MPKDKKLDELVIGIIGVGGATSLGFCFLNELLRKYHLIGKGGIARILVNDIDKKKTKSLTEDHIHSSIIEPVELKKIADEADIYFFTYAAPAGAQKEYHGIDRELRKKFFNANVQALYSKEMRDAFGGSGGLGIFCTNPPDYLAYFAQGLFGWEKNQSIGFNHADTHRLRKLKRGLNLINSWMIGDHSPNSFAHFSKDIYRLLDVSCNENKEEIEKWIREVIKEVHKKGFQIFGAMGHSNASCATPLADVAEGIVTGRGEFQMSYYIEIPKDLPPSLLKELTDLQNITGIALDGICTGVPVIFSKNNGLVRAELAPGFGKGHVFDASVLADAEEGRYSAKRAFASVIENNAKEILTAKQYGKKQDGKPLLPIENTLLVLNILCVNNLLLYETKKDIINGDKSLLFPKKKSSHECAGLEIAAISAFNNKLVTVSNKRVDLWKFPYKNIAELVSGKEDSIEHEADLGPSGNSIHKAALQKDTVYLAGSWNVEKRDFNGKTLASTKEPLDLEIRSIFAGNTGLFCCCSKGKIVEFGLNLEQKSVYSDEGNTANMRKARLIDFEGNKYLFGINDSGSIFMWKQGDLKAKKTWQSKKPCFDVQVEQYEENIVICIYKIADDDRLEVERVLPGSEKQFNTLKTNIECSAAIQDIQAEGNDVYLITNNRVRSFLNKEERNLDISLQNIGIDQASIIRYKK